MQFPPTAVTSFSLLVVFGVLLVTSQPSDECLLNNNLCIQSFDGCNTCSCLSDSSFPICTKRACIDQDLTTTTCDKCANNLQFGVQGCDACWRSKTCNNRDGAEICILACIQECRCPVNAPFYDPDTLSCLTEKECDQLDNNDDNDDNNNDKELTCPELCINYFDGCNECFCSNGDGFGGCTKRGCPNELLEEPACDECINNLVWKENGSKCWKERTCDNKRGNKCKECRQNRGPQCQCPQNKPFWDQQTQSCLGRRECRQIEKERDRKRKIYGKEYGRGDY